jgi:hypothetical protein
LNFITNKSDHIISLIKKVLIDKFKYDKLAEMGEMTELDELVDLVELVNWGMILDS